MNKLKQTILTNNEIWDYAEEIVKERLMKGKKKKNRITRNSWCYKIIVLGTALAIRDIIKVNKK